MSKPSRIHPLQTIEPGTGRKICGSWRWGKRTEFEFKGEVLEEVVKDPDLFRYYFCCKAPDHASRSGRCVLHGSKSGRPPSSGKYTNVLRILNDDELQTLGQKDRHKDLNEELGIISKFIEQQLPLAMTETTTAANRELVSQLDRLEKAIEKLDFNKVRAISKEMRDKVEQAYDQKQAKKDIQEAVKVYAEVFNVEMKHRHLSGDYMHKNKVAEAYTIIFNLAARFIKDQHEKEQLRQELIGFARGLDKRSLPEVTNRVAGIISFEDQNERSASDTLDAEFSAVNVSED